VTCCGKLFQKRGPATTKDRSPRVERVVRRMHADDDDTPKCFADNASTSTGRQTPDHLTVVSDKDDPVAQYRPRMSMLY